MELEQRELNIQDIQGDTIRKKEYLGNRNLYNVVIPPYVKKIEAWGFAYCKNLERIWIPKSIHHIEDSAFDGCERLKIIYLYEAKSSKFVLSDVKYYEKEGKLLAFGVRHFSNGIERKELFDFSNLGTEQWYHMYDEMLFSYVKEPDEKGFQPFLAGGEEDYEDPDNNIENFCFRQQQEKADGILKRLSVDSKILHEDTFTTYIKEHFDAVVKVLQEMREESILALKILGKYHIFTEDRMDDYLAAFEGSLFTEARAYLLSQKEVLCKRKNDGVWKQFEI